MSGRFRLELGIIARLLVALLFTWNQVYVPLHLAGSKHQHSGSPHHHHHHEHNPEDGAPEDSAHHPHPVTDHLFGYFGHSVEFVPPEIIWCSLETAALPECCGFQNASLTTPRGRGPPSLSAFIHCA